MSAFGSCRRILHTRKKLPTRLGLLATPQTEQGLRGIFCLPRAAACSKMNQRPALRAAQPITAGTIWGCWAFFTATLLKPYLSFWCLVSLAQCPFPESLHTRGLHRRFSGWVLGHIQNFTSTISRAWNTRNPGHPAQGASPSPPGCIRGWPWGSIHGRGWPNHLLAVVVPAGNHGHIRIICPVHQPIGVVYSP